MVKLNDKQDVLMKLFLILTASLIINLNAQEGIIEIPSIFSDNMVLQQKTNVKFWGKAEAGIKVNVKTSWGREASAVTKNDGTWVIKVKTPVAGGPYTVTLTVGDSITEFKNVMTGEVWVCSGQSNMEMPLKGWPPRDTILNSADEISYANNSNIRLITVKKDYSLEKKFNFIGKWKECSPSTAADFSASAYYFGKKLYDELKVPIGLIFTSWGGTPIEAWTSNEAMNKAGLLKEKLENLKEDQKQYYAFLQYIQSRKLLVDIRKKPEDKMWKGLEFDDKEFSGSDYINKSWGEISLPGEWEKQGVGDFDGIVWLRKQIELPASWLNKSLILELGPVDDMDRTYVNGELAGAMEDPGAWDDDRVYKIPASVNNSAILTVAVRVLDTQGGGGINGNKDKMKLINPETGENISLDGLWKYYLTAEYFDRKFFDVENHIKSVSPPKGKIVTAVSPTVLYNAMIYPITNYIIKGAIWYQGESNSWNEDAGLYQKQLPVMIQDWRNAWGIGDFPFYFVQIAPYNYTIGAYSQVVRDAQLKTLSLANTGMAVTMDIGELRTIHPSDKKDVGCRLALWALAKNYGKPVYFSGPLYKSFSIDGNNIIVTFNYADGMVIKPVDDKNNFEIAGEDKVFKPADVIIKGNKLIISNKEMKHPVAVRYAWSNTSPGTLFNKAGLPASSFRTDNWDYMK